MSEFKIGDKVVCISNGQRFGRSKEPCEVIEGKRYTVSGFDDGSVDQGGSGYVCVNNQKLGFLPTRFSKIVLIDGDEYYKVGVNYIPAPKDVNHPSNAEQGSYWRGIKGGLYIVVDNEQNAFECTTQKVYKLPPSAEFVSSKAVVKVMAEV